MVGRSLRLYSIAVQRYNFYMNRQRTTALIICIAGLVGLADSFFLVTEYFNALTSSGAPTPCSPSSLVNCTKTVQGEWAHLLGVSNPLFGMLWYGMFAFYGYARFNGSQFTTNVRYVVLLLTVLGIAFSYTLYGGSVLSLRGVCPFCLTSTLASTILLFGFIIDDRQYKDAIITNGYLPIIRILQAFSLSAFGIGLPVFLAINIPLLVEPSKALTHWSFPLMIFLIIGMWATNWWAYKGIQLKK